MKKGSHAKSLFYVKDLVNLPLSQGRLQNMGETYCRQSCLGINIKKISKLRFSINKEQ